MVLLTFIVKIFAATTLLLYSVRMIQTGINRTFGVRFTNRLAQTKSVMGSVLLGLVMAIVMQSSIAVTTLATAMASNRVLRFGACMAVIIGADLGSALLIQVLSLDLSWLLPLLMLTGGTMFLRAKQRKTKQIGRMLLGIALVLVSLLLLRQAVAPIATSDALPIISAMLEQDFITAFIVGACLAFIMHSSLAAILMILTLVGTGVTSLEAGLCLVLGANFGSALVPIWLCRGMNSISRRVPAGNFVFRGVGAVIFLFAVQKLPLTTYLGHFSDTQMLVLVHIIFNTLLIAALPLRHLVEKLVQALITEEKKEQETIPSNHRSALDYSVIENPDLALANLRREVLRMSYMVLSMTEPLLDIFKKQDEGSVKMLCRENAHLADAFDKLRDYVAAFAEISFTKKQRKQLRYLTEYAAQLCRIGEIIVNNLAPRIRDNTKSGVSFSAIGEAELVEIHKRLNANITIASNLVLAAELDTAKLVIENKDAISKSLRESQKKHFERIREGSTQSVQSSNMHLEVLHSFRDINGRIASIAYPQLAKADLLNESRLIDDILPKA